MHGRPRAPPGFVPDSEEVRKQQAKAQQLDSAVRKVLAAKKDSLYHEGYLKVAAGILQKNPDIYSLWNYRREALQEAFSGESAAETVENELKLTETCLIVQPKSYSTWHQRKWLIQKGLTNLEEELELVDKFLLSDTRNFHGWNYRFFLVEQLGRNDEDELEYTHQLIVQDYSNFSAWHYRSLLLPRVHAARGHHTIQELTDATPRRCEADALTQDQSLPPLPVYELKSEFKLLATALHMDPEDASAWSYHRWLLDGLVQNVENANGTDNHDQVSQAVRAQLLDEAACCTAIVEAEKQHSEAGSKWPIVTLAHVTRLIRQLGGLAEEDEKESKEREAGYFQQLRAADPLRKHYYQDQENALLA